LRDKTRPSRVPKLATCVAEPIVALTMELPPSEATHWTRTLMAKGVRVSVSSILRSWRAHGLRPHHVQQFRLSNDPKFIATLREWRHWREKKPFGLYFVDGYPIRECMNALRLTLISAADEGESAQILFTLKIGLLRAEAANRRIGRRRMGVAVEITRGQYSADELREFAVKSRDTAVARRLLAVAVVLEEASRSDAARQAGMDLQTLRDWAHRPNEVGVAGLAWTKDPGATGKLTAAQMAELRELVGGGPTDPAQPSVKVTAPSSMHVPKPGIGLSTTLTVSNPSGKEIRRRSISRAVAIIRSLAEQKIRHAGPASR